MKVWILMNQRNLIFSDLKEISIGRIDFDNPKVYSDTSDGLVKCILVIGILFSTSQPEVFYVKISKNPLVRKYFHSRFPGGDDF